MKICFIPNDRINYSAPLFKQRFLPPFFSICTQYTCPGSIQVSKQVYTERERTGMGGGEQDSNSGNNNNISKTKTRLTQTKIRL